MKTQRKSFWWISLLALLWIFGFIQFSVSAAEALTGEPSAEVPANENAMETPGNGNVSETPETENAAEEPKETEENEKNGWHQEGGNTYYYVSGRRKTGWMEIDGKKYYFSPKSGRMYTGKHKIGRSTYYFKANGQRRTGWVKIKKKKYYFSLKSGKMYTGKHEIGKAIYYFKKSGQMQTKWVKINEKKYYFSPKTGKVLTGRQKIGKKAYYFNKRGILQTSGWLTAGKKTYYCSGKGILKSGWMNDDGKYYYFSPKNNVMLTDWQKIGDYKYYFMPSGIEKGVLQSNCIVDTSTGSFYVDAEGIQVTSDEIVQAVGFVKSYTDSSWSAEVKLQKCFEALWRNYSYQRFYDTPAAWSMSGYANYMFANRMGNCFRYAASYACVARVLGYESRVAVGSVSARNGGMTPHGWAEVNVDGTWYICDPNMQRNYPNINSYMCTDSTYAYRHTCSVRYTLTIRKGGVSWE